MATAQEFKNIFKLVKIKLKVMKIQNGHFYRQKARNLVKDIHTL